jgi:hypothetical protein
MGEKSYRHFPPNLTVLETSPPKPCLVIYGSPNKKNVPIFGELSYAADVCKKKGTARPARGLISKIFISHSSANNAHALALAQWLEDNGWGEYFLDITPSRGLSPGERWQEALKAAADRCEAVLFLISPAWRDSRWCLAEFLLAKQLGKPIFGALIETTPLETLPQEMTVEWQLCDLVDGTEKKAYRVYSDPVVPQTEISFASPGLDRLKIGLQKSGLDPSTFKWPPPNDPNRAPYRGLKALEAEDAAIFFGREAPIIRGLDTLRRIREHKTESMFVILGASGAGKSSFLRAGLWPRLKRDDRHFLPLSIIRPERAVITGPTGLIVSLEQAFRDRGTSKTRTDIRTVLQRPDGLGSLTGELQALVQQALGPEAESPTILIPIDQGEELFSAEGREEADVFLALLRDLLLTSASGHPEPSKIPHPPIMLIAIRSDSYEWLQTEPKLERVKRGIFDLQPLARDEYKMVIEGPARRATEAGQALKVEPALTEQLLKDMEGADALPLLAFTLERLFVEYGGNGDLRLAEYELLGGLRGSIETAVEEAFAAPEEKPVVPSGPGTTRAPLAASVHPMASRCRSRNRRPQTTGGALAGNSHSSPSPPRTVNGRTAPDSRQTADRGRCRRKYHFRNRP